MTMRRDPLTFVLLGISSLAICASAQAVSFSQMTVFGDSLSDTGNINNATFGLVPGSGYFDGRFSNGKLYVEYLAEGLAVAEPSPSSEDGRNYAYGGAWAGDQDDLIKDRFIEDLEEQVPRYLSERTPMADELFVLYAGSNDLLGDPGNVGSAISSIRTQINRLAQAGARQFFVPNLPRLDLAPRNQGTSNQAPLLAAVSSFNQQLDSVLDDLETDYADAAVYRLDVAMVFSNLFADPSAFGFTNVVTPAMGVAVIDPSTYLFWDDLHPTTAGHELLADFALAAILESNNLAGDYNDNGVVDAADYTIWADSFNTNVSPFTGADGNGDGLIDAADYTVWADNFGTISALNSDAFPIPEPASLTLLGAAGLLLLARRR